MTPSTNPPTNASADPAPGDVVPGGVKVSGARTCVGCGGSIELDDSVTDEHEIVRVILGPRTDDGPREIAIDAGARRSGGRGASLHPTPKCVTLAAQRGLARSFKAKLTIDGLPVDARRLAATIVAALDRRIEGLLGAAVRSKHAAIGSEPVCAALRSTPSGTHALVVLATNAEAAAHKTEVRRAVAEGRAVAWRDKEGLAAAVLAGSRSEGVGVVAVVERHLSAAVRTAVQQADGLRGILGRDLGMSAETLTTKTAVE